jgi:hypothetical protein
MNTATASTLPPGGTAAAPRLDPQNPWPGLAPYDEASREYFEGRDEEADTLTGLIAAYPVVSLYGKSGLGKSSLLQAGVFPSLRERGFLPVYARLDFSSAAASPWDHQLASRLCEAADAAGLERPPLRQGEGLWSYLHRKDFELWTDDNHLRPPVLVLDQFEEVFSRPGTTKKDLAPIFDVLGDLVENRIPSAIASDKAQSAALDLIRQRYRIVLSFREDFLPDLRTWEPRLPSLLRQSLRLLPMSRERAVEAVARAGKAVLAPDTAGAIVDFVAGGQEGGLGSGQPSVEPVMLSLCCTQLNRRRPAGKLIDVDLLRTAGPNIIEDFYAEAMRGMPDAVHRFVEDHLLQGDRTRGSYARDEALSQGYIDAAQLHQLTSVHRLLRIDPQGNVPRIELIHDRLVEVVRRARDTRRARLETEEAKRLEDANRHRRAKYRIAVVLGVVSLLLVVSAFQTLSARRSAVEAAKAEGQARNAEAQARNAEAEARKSADQARNAEARASAEAKAANARLQQVSLLATYGWVGAKDPWLYENAVNADAAIKQLVGETTSAGAERRRGTTLEIWTKDIDQDRIRLALSSLGFPTQLRQAKLKEDATNAVWFGSRADINDVKLVALALMRAGIAVRAIRPIQEWISSKDQALIQAGAARDANEWPPMTAEQVLAAKAFVRTASGGSVVAR